MLRVHEAKRLFVCERVVAGLGFEGGAIRVYNRVRFAFCIHGGGCLVVYRGFFRGLVVSISFWGYGRRVDHEKQKTYGVCHEVCGREGCLQVSTLQQGVGEACHAGV